MPLPPLHANEIIEELRPCGLRIIQPRRGHRHALDPLLLSDFVRVDEGAAVADLGTGGGVIPLLLAQRGVGRVLGVEIQAELADRARRSALLNGLEGVVEIVQGDVRQLPVELAGLFDVVTANPPYRPLGQGRVAPDAQRAAARFELAGGIDDFTAAAGRLLCHGGSCYIVYLAERLPELLAALNSADLRPSRLRCVHHRAGEVARLVLVEGRKGGRGALVIEPPLWVAA
jgi:tRNA1Val (adenine37-N6)-methyltransferase